MSPVMRSLTSPRLVATVMARVRSIVRRATSASVRKRAVELIRSTQASSGVAGGPPGNRFATNTCQIYVPGSKPCPSKVNC